MRQKRITAAVILLVAAVAWALVNKPVEGPVLLQITKTHGITAADVPSILAVLLAVVLIRRR